MIALDVDGRGKFTTEHSVRVGRDPAWANLVVDGDYVSRHHLEIRPIDDGYRVWDLGSRNGTSVNKRRVGEGGTPLTEGDVISVGGSVSLRVLVLGEPDTQPETALREDQRELRVEAHPDVFVVQYRTAGKLVRDTMSYQLGLALSLLALYQRDAIGPVPDVDLRAIVWRGDADQKVHGDINRLLLRLRQWFSRRDVDPPPIIRRKRAAATRLDLPAGALQVEPEGWLYKFLDDA